MLAAQLGAETMRNGMPFRDAATSDELMKKYQSVSKENPMKRFTPSTEKGTPAVTKVENLLDKSDVISFNGLTTLVPKRAIIQIPEDYEKRINNHTPGAKIVGWLDFYRLNRGWISTVEVSFAQAKGESPIPPELMKTLSKSGNLVVAVLKTGPISVMPPKVEETEAAEKSNPNPKQNP
jgi:hypothetical protein